ncbi:uncharacterized protein HMF8227_00618 [Saliniradius amylolyticus]|uniref:Uncharacterized protein n=1 Tax=Saliniradius amylolyticus TaxID=2183582 RepID=A0A2S2E0E5_9ALTE|nr:uncharacterized protein HMF8227_00618 [Saliniradius amylolyticus]
MPETISAVPLAEIQSQIQQGQFDAALASIDHHLTGNVGRDDKVELCYMRIVCQRYLKQYGQALESATQLLSLRPDYARAWQERGYLYQAQKQPYEAAKAFYQATRLNPALLASWQSLLALYQAQGNEQAVKLTQARIERLKRLPKPILAATDLMNEGKLLQAEKLCRQFLRQHKHHHDGLCLLADIAQQMKVYDDAEFLLESAVEIYPDSAQAREQYASLLIKIGKYYRAKQQTEKLINMDPNNERASSLQATSHIGLGELDEGIKGLKYLLSKTPEKYGLWLELGHAYKTQGQRQQAINAYRNAYLKNANCGDAFWSLANTKTYQFTEDEIERMREVFSSENAAENDKIHAHFALGKAFEDRQNYADSFEQYRLGNDLKFGSNGYSAQFTEDRVEKQIQSLTPELFEQFAGAGCDSTDPIFIVGLPRSGSTLLEQILASHSQVDGTMELHNILGLARRLSVNPTRNGQVYPKSLADLKPELMRRFGEQYLEETKAYRQGAPFFIDKMPNNFMHVGLIKLILPNAKIIDARRHPMACCFSGFKQLFGEGQDFSYDLEAIGRYYRDYVRLMDHWDEVLPGAVLRVQHEDVVNDLEGQVKRLLDFCGLPFESQCLDFYKTERAIQTPSAEQVRQPIYRSGLAQWKHFEPYLEPLKRALGDDLLNEYERFL